MSDYVYDGSGVLPDGKVDSVLPQGASAPWPRPEVAVAAEWNEVAQAVKDLRGAALGGRFHGLADDADTAPLSPAGGVHLRSKAGDLEVSEDGKAFTAHDAAALVADTRCAFTELASVGMTLNLDGYQTTRLLVLGLAASEVGTKIEVITTDTSINLLTLLKNDAVASPVVVASGDAVVLSDGLDFSMTQDSSLVLARSSDHWYEVSRSKMH